MINSKILICVFALMMAVTLPSCELFKEAAGDLVVTTSDNLIPGTEDQALIVPRDKLPDEVLLAFGDATIVLAHKDIVKEGAPMIEVDPGTWSLDTLSSFLGWLFDIAVVFFPGLAIFEGVSSILFRRKRELYGDALKSVIPYNGKIDVIGGFANVVKAVGLVHSRDDVEVAKKSVEVEKKGNQGSRKVKVKS